MGNVMLLDLVLLLIQAEKPSALIWRMLFRIMQKIPAILIPTLSSGSLSKLVKGVPLSSTLTGCNDRLLLFRSDRHTFNTADDCLWRMHTPEKVVLFCPLWGSTFCSLEPQHPNRVEAMLSLCFQFGFYRADGISKLSRYPCSTEVQSQNLHQKYHTHNCGYWIWIVGSPPLVYSGCHPNFTSELARVSNNKPRWIQPGL